MSWWWLVAAAWAGALPADPAVLEAGMRTEIERAMTGLKLPDQPDPYLVNIEVIEGQVVTTTSQFGAITSHDAGPYRNARVEVRVGDHTMNSGNFMGAFGVADGVVGRGLPDDDVSVALRREVWLALDQAYKGATQQLAAKKAARTGRSREFADDLSPVAPLHRPLFEPRSVDGEAMKDLVQALSAVAAKVPDLEEGGAIGRDWQGRRLLASSEDINAWLRTGHTVVRVAAAARAKDGAVVRDARWWVARTPDQLPSRVEMLAEVEQMMAWVIAAKDAPVEEDYLGPVLFEGPAATELFRQLLQAQVSGTPPPETAPDPFSDDVSAAPTARIGRRLLPNGWTVVDDAASDASAAGSYTHDFDGVPPEAVTLVEDGVLRRVLMSRVPRKNIAQSTGHGRSLGNARREAMPAVLRITPNRARSPAALRRVAMGMARQTGLEYLLVVRRIIPPAMANDLQVAFTGEGPLPGLTTPLEVFRLYPDGREQVVRNLGFVGVDRRVLRDIVAAGQANAPVDVMDSPGASGRFSIGAAGGLPATWTAPPVVIAEMELRGTAGGEVRAVPPPVAVAGD